MDHLLIKYQLNINRNWALILISAEREGDEAESALGLVLRPGYQNPPRPYSYVSFPSQEILIKVYSAGRIYAIVWC